MKSTSIFPVSIYASFILFISISNAADYRFKWDESPPSDNVIEYKIYYRLNSTTYNVSVFETVRITNPKFNPADPTWGFTLPDVADEYCFVATAIAEIGGIRVESIFSDEVGKGTTCGPIVNGDKGGGGGFCFIGNLSY